MKKIFATIAFVMLMGLCPVSVMAGISDNDITLTEESATTVSGKCYDDVMWTISDMDNDGVYETLTYSVIEKEVQGPPYVTSNVPSEIWAFSPLSWTDKMPRVGDIKTIIIEEGITGVSFGMATSSMWIPDSNFQPYQYMGVFYNVEKVVFPSTLKMISDNSFLGCKLLKGPLNLPDSVETIGNNAFAECYALDGELKLPASLKEIGQYAFASDNHLSGNLVFPNQLEKIRLGAFQGCTSLSGDVILPNSVKEIRQSVFNNTGFDGTLRLSSGIDTVIQGSFSGTHFKKAIIPAGINKIGKDIFAGCKELEEVVIEAGFTGEIEQERSFLYYGDGSYILDSRNGMLKENPKLSKVSNYSNVPVLLPYYYHNPNGSEVYRSIWQTEGENEKLVVMLTSATAVAKTPEGYTSCGVSMKPVDDYSYLDGVLYYDIYVGHNNGKTIVEGKYYIDSQQKKYISLEVTVKDSNGRSLNSANADVTPEGSYYGTFSATFEQEYDSASHVDITKGKASKEQVSGFVNRMYTVVLNRDAESGGKDYWSEQLASGMSDGASLAQGFVTSEEFKNRNLDNDQYVTVLYNTFFDRVPDEEGKAYWVSLLNQNVSREEVLAGFVNSKEFGVVCDEFGIARGTMEKDGSSIYNEGVRNFVLRIYTKALGRSGETEGVEYWSYAINHHQISALDAAKEFFSSQEFLNKNLNDTAFISVCYETFLGRSPEDDGLNYWKLQLASGMTRDELLSQFSESKEFKNIMAQYGL